MANMTRVAFFACYLSLSILAIAQQPSPLPDLDVTYIERTPRYPGYALNYELKGHEGVPILVENKPTRKPLASEQTKSIKRQPANGDFVTFTAHVRNCGNAVSQPWEYAWAIDGVNCATGTTANGLKPGEEKAVSMRWKWRDGRHFMRFTADPMFKTRDASLVNNAREDATDAWSLIWAVDRITYSSFAKCRNMLGTTSFEDWAQWHVDRMNKLFEISPVPGKRPSSDILPRIRCDKIVVEDNLDSVWDRLFGAGVSALDAGYDGGWTFGRREDCADWAAAPDWGLIHEWGHQLGLTDEYALDRAGFMNLVADEKGDPLLIERMSPMRVFMMHGHGPTTFSPVCMEALIRQHGRRRGYYGDFYYDIPLRNCLRVLDRAGKPVSGAEVAIWRDRDDSYYGKPDLVGKTDSKGLYELLNRPAPRITTDKGFTQHDNPFGKINVVGPGDVLFIRIKARSSVNYAWLDIEEMLLATWTGHRDCAIYEEKTLIPVTHAPTSPSAPVATMFRDNVHLNWKSVSGAVYYRLYHAKPGTMEFSPVGIPTKKLAYEGRVGDGSYHRFAVTAIDAKGRESALSPFVGVVRFVTPWGLAVASNGNRYVRDRAYGQTVLIKPDGNAVGLVGSVHYHFEGSYDIAVDPNGRLLSAKWGDGYDPNPGFRVQDAKLNLVVDYRKPEGSAPGQFLKPMGIGANSKSHIFVADTGNDRVQEFGPDGTFIRLIGVGELNQPMKVAFDKEDRLYIADSVGNRIAVYEADANGDYKLVKKLTGGIKEPVYVLVDEIGRVFASTNRIAGVYMFGVDGKIAWKYIGAQDEPLTGPRGLAFDGKGNLLIVDEASERILTVPIPNEGK